MPSVKAAMKMRRNEMIHSKADVGIEVLSGRIWLTHMGCARDWILESGDRATLWAHRGSIACAMAESEIWVERGGERRRLGAGF